MTQDAIQRELLGKVWKHIDAEEFAAAEMALRQLIDITDPDDSIRLWALNGRLAAVLNSLSRPSEGTEMYRRALVQARRAGESHSAVGLARYMLATQYLDFGDPRDALAETEPVPVGVGYVQCLLHSVSAQALWKLGRRNEAQVVARRAMDAAPTDERRADMAEDLAHILNAG